MRRMTTCLLAALLAVGLLTAAPALATYGAVVEVPTDPVYSPFGGPVIVTFVFDGDDPARVFTIRLRRPGHGPIKEKDVVVDPGVDTSPHEVSLSWQDLSVGNPTDYVVDVRRQGESEVITSETFTVLPSLVADVAAHPSPFYPLVIDGYKDHTTIGFSLSADTGATTIRVYAADTYGRCCGTEVRSEDLGPLPAGDHGWSWDGTADDDDPVAKGVYFARVEATDTDDVSMVSKPTKVEVTKGQIRLTATKEKFGSAYGGVFDHTPTAIGGSCLVARDTTTHLASILCANANISMFWRWSLAPDERIEKVSFAIDGGAYGCHKRVSHTKTRSIIRVTSPPTSTCSISEARIVYSYPVQA
ncbi:MAG TPA: FlgD immunoglobulin-like domain containing protein [Actinomycetota bacterium]|nr:FlgD immunoglobulin-like domain containing protein [Actinomycetota bacterium]